MTTAVAAPEVVRIPEAAAYADLLQDTYAPLTEAIRPLVRLEAGSVSPRPGGEQITGRRLVRDPALREWLVELSGKRIRDAHGVTPRRDVAALDVLHEYAFLATVAMSGPWLLTGRVPRVALDGLGQDEVSGALTVSPSGIACLPGDPASGLPGVHVVADAEELRRELRSAVADHLGPVLDVFRPLLRRGERVMWGLATDELTEGIWYLGRVTGQERRAAAAADALLPGGTAPFAGAAGFRACEGPGPGAAGGPTRTRINCCLWYTLTPQKLCATCPRRAA